MARNKKLKVGDVIYAHCAENHFDLRKYQIIKVGHQYYTVREQNLCHSWCNCKIDIKTFTEKCDEAWAKQRIWFRTREEYELYRHRQELTKSINSGFYRLNKNYNMFTTEELEALSDLLQKYAKMV